MDGTAAMYRTLMLYVNEIGFYALNEKYSTEKLLVNILVTAKRGSKVLGSLRRMETEQKNPTVNLRQRERIICCLNRFKMCNSCVS